MKAPPARGAPVVVAAAMLIGLGFPRPARRPDCLVGKHPAGSLRSGGVPTIMMGTVTGVSSLKVSSAVGIE